MARSFHQSLLAAAVALVVGGSAIAQGSPLQEAVTLLRLNKKDEALEKLREILTADPSNEEAHNYYMSVSQDEWYLLMTEQGEIQQIARSILDRAKVQQKERSRDEATIAALVATATDKTADYATRQNAVNTLVANHGEFAVPALADRLGNADDHDGQILAISALSQIRSAAVLPLIELLRSSDDLVVQNAAAALNLIGDKRALPFLAHLANDERANVSTIARKFVAKHGGAGDAVAMMLEQAARYLRGEVPVGGYSDVVWALKDGKLVATDVPSMLYPSELAKSVASTAAAIAPQSLDARSMLAQASLAQASMIESALAQGDASAQGLEGLVPELKIVAHAAGVDALRSALEAGVNNGLAPVAIGAIHALGRGENIDTIDQSTLVRALDSGNKQVRYAAAEALVRASRGAEVPAADRVVAVLADAVTEEKVRTIQVIAPTLDRAAAVESTNNVRGFALNASSDAVSGMRSLLINPNVDVVVINEILPDRLPEDVIGNVKKDPRMANARILIVAKDEEAARARFGDGVGIIQAPLTSENLMAAVDQALEGVSNVTERAEAFAANASSALLEMARRKLNIGAALENLALQLNRGDAVAVPAARSLGLSGAAPQLNPLATALANGSAELKKASAEALGNILGRMDGCPDEIAMALMSALEAATDVELRTTLAIALGKAKIDSQKKLELMQKLVRVAGTSSEG
jgi:HEAT repeat protein